MIGAHEATLYAEPLIGYRAWRMTEDAMLVGCNFPKWTWPIDEDATAECLGEVPSIWHMPNPPQKHRPNQVPVKGHRCGLYGYDGYKGLQDASFANAEEIVRGVCIGWGKAWLHRLGWRAKYARPVALLYWSERRHLPSKDYSDADDFELSCKWNAIQQAVADTYDLAIAETVDELGEAVRDYLR